MVKSSALRFFSLLAAAILTGCVSITPPTKSLSGIKSEQIKNYNLGQEYSVNVGEAIITRKSYYYKESQSSDRVRASNDFQAAAEIPLNPRLVYSGRKGEELLVLGTTEIKGRNYRIVSIGQTSRGLPVGMLCEPETGNLASKAVWRNGFGAWVTGTITFRIDRPETRFTPVKTIEIDQSQQYENYEIIYTGRLGENVTFVYREYTPDNLARPAFSQNLTYNLAEAKEIRFRKLQMLVVESTNEKIKLKIVSDS